MKNKPRRSNVGGVIFFLQTLTQLSPNLHSHGVSLTCDIHIQGTYTNMKELCESWVGGVVKVSLLIVGEQIPIGIIAELFGLTRSCTSQLVVSCSQEG
jgi:hypothetical protein